MLIGIIGGLLYCFFSKLLLVLNIDDPVEAASVHYINGIWGIIAVAIFHEEQGWGSGYEKTGEFLGWQIIGLLAISAWTMVWALAIMIPFYLFKVHKYHPVIEILGAGNMKMGEMANHRLSKYARKGYRGIREVSIN